MIKINYVADKKSKQPTDLVSQSLEDYFNITSNSKNIIFPANFILYNSFSIKSIQNLFKNFPKLNNKLEKNKQNYKVYFIESGTRDFWVEKTNNYLFNKNEYMHIFLWYSGLKSSESSNKMKKQNEFTNELFGFSRLFRDAVKKDKNGFEIDLAVDSEIFLKNLKFKLKSLEEYKNTKYSTIFERIWKTKEEYFNFPIMTEKEEFRSLLIDYYSYGLNRNSFKEIINNSDEYGKLFKGLKFEDIKIGHELAGLGLELIKKKAGNDVDDISKLPSKKLGNLANWSFRINLISNLVKLLVFYDEPKDNLNILLIDDNPEKIDSELNQLQKWLNLSNNYKVNIDQHLPNTSIEVLDDLKEKRIFNYDFVLVDLDYDGEPKGFEYLRYFRRLKSIYNKPYIIVFSRSDDPASIQKSLNMGALFFASKQDFAYLLLELFKVLSLVQKINNSKGQEKNISLGNNWDLLSKLPLSKILELKSNKIDGNSYASHLINQDAKFDFSNNLEDELEYRWIKKLPKAELHNHIGSVLGPDLTPKTSLLVLSQFFKKKGSNYPINKIIEFISPIVSDPFLFELHDGKDRYKEELDEKSKWYKFKKLFIIDSETEFFDQSIFTIVSESLNLKANIIKPEEVLLDPQDKTLEKRFIPLSKLKKSNYFRTKMNLLEANITYDEIILFFILLLEIKNKITFSDVRDTKTILVEIKKSISIILKPVSNKQKLDKNFEESIAVFIDKLVVAIDSNHEVKNELVNCNGKRDRNIIQFLMSANSLQRCIPFENKGLFNYLRGCEYGGAPHLQSKESLFLAAHHIINNYALPENIRYLDLRCSIDGYTKFKLMEEIDATDNLLAAFSYWQREALQDEKKVHVNIIVTAKRHKSIKAFEKNVELVINKYEHNMSSPINFWEGDSKVVSFDIAGIEKSNRVSKFRNQLQPLLKKCIPTTIHAGEEDSADAIWEAVYDAHVQRLGHALTLKDNSDLENLIRETHVNVELCPVSNFLTNNKYSFSQGNYPLRNYLNKRISISINTDNPYVSNTNLTKEFLFAAKLSGGLTKWEILKILLYSFKAITIPKVEKSKLLNEIDEEIFQLMQEEEI